MDTIQIYENLLLNLLIDLEWLCNAAVQQRARPDVCK
jgi:hypothetical protein